ncbi:MAG: hypothetical protein IJ506_04740 [Clostridia bacterium]|nr:hypothetical protein [Clostridia bacterium]
MKSFIRELFEKLLETPEYNANFGIEMNSNRLYEKFKPLLSEKEKKLLNEYIDECVYEQTQAEEKMYRCGFKTAMLLVFEILSSVGD